MKTKTMKFILISTLFLSAAVSLANSVTAWDWWSCVNTDPKSVIKVSENFLWGTALSEYQNSGAECCVDSNWSDWEKNLNVKSGKACDFWHRYPEDIELLKDLGINSLRFSVEWCKVEPKEGKFSKEALDHYADFCDKLLQAGITPMITLHHFVHPKWFDEKGGFEKEKNIVYFEKFCAVVFKYLGSKVKLWCTINEPTVYALQGYFRGVFPPGKKMKASKMLLVVKNLLQAHIQVYHRLKAMPYGETAQIGLVHQYLFSEPYRSWHPLDHIPGLLLNNMLNKPVLKFLKTGTYEFKSCLFGNFIYEAPKNKPLMDFIGLNYYSHPLMKFEMALSMDEEKWFPPTCHPGELLTDMPYRMCPIGFYKAITHMKELNLPIYITENGIADGRDDRRETFLKQYIFAMGKAINEGCDVRGYYYWSFMDNFEWDIGYSMKFGLYAVDHETQERTLRPSARYYASVIAQSQAKSVY